MSTATLAAPSTGARAAELPLQATQYVSFYVDRQLLGVPVEAVQEVLATQSIAPVPLAPREIAGLLNLRGQIVTAVDLRRRLGLPDREPGANCLSVVVRSHGESFSLLVDEVGEVIDVTGNRVEPVPRSLSAAWRSMARGVIRVEQQLFLVVDLDSVLSLN